VINRKRTIIITGILTPRQWDRHGNITAAGISTADEKEYVIADDSLTPQLLKHLRQLIRVRGELRPTPEGAEVLAVITCGAARGAGGWNGNSPVNEEDRRSVTDGDWYPSRRPPVKSSATRTNKPEQIQRQRKDKLK